MRTTAVVIALVLIAANGTASPAVTPGRVRACLPGADGGVLVGTDGGLLVLDAAGDRVGRLGTGEGLPGARIHAVAAGADGAVWVGTEAGLARLAPSVDGAGALRVARAWAGEPVRALLADGDALYVATWGGGVLRLAGPDARPRRLRLRRGSPATGAERTTSFARLDGVVYVGTAGAGVYRLDSDRAVVPVRLELPHAHVHALAALEGRLWIGTLGGVVAWDPADGAIEVVSPADVRAFAVLEGALALGTYGDGLQGADGLPALAGLDAGRTRFVDAVATAHGAVCVAARSGLWLRRSGAFVRASLDGPPSADISALARDGDRVWIGTFDGGLAVRTSTGALEAIPRSLVDHPLLDRRVDAVAVEPRAEGGSRVWVGTARGLTILDSDADGAWRARRLTTADGLPHDEVHALAVLRSGALLLGTGRGAAIVHGDRLERLGRKRGLPKRAVWAVAEDEDGALWLGTTVGLYRLRPGRRAERFCAATGHLPDDWVTALAIRGDTVWVGTYAHGVVRLGPPGATGRAATPLGLEHVNPGGLLLHGDHLYAATMEGLWSAPVDRMTGGPGDGADGDWVLHEGAAPSRDVTAVVAGDVPDGALIVASRRGLGLLPIP